MPTRLKKAVADVLQLTQFSPNQEVDRVMTTFVNEVIKGSPRHIVFTSRRILQNAQRVSAETESEMEKYWARLIINSPQPRTALENFPYKNNYEELTKRELELIRRSGLNLNEEHAALVIGSGPLPLSAVEINRQSKALVDQVDISEEAVQLGKSISDKLKLESQHYEAKGEDVLLDKKYHLILIAALAGSTVKDKQAIIDNVLPHLHQDGRIIIRSARGTRKLLYPAIKPKSVKRVKLLNVYHPKDSIINSVFVYRRT